MTTHGFKRGFGAGLSPPAGRGGRLTWVLRGRCSALVLLALILLAFITLFRATARATPGQAYSYTV